MENEERLRQLIEEAVSNAVAKLMEPQSPVLVSRDEAAKRLEWISRHSGAGLRSATFPSLVASGNTCIIRRNPSAVLRQGRP